ncbi:hypothetical protein VNO78_20506 [Psophocarpus tetragonolobus]|uniref:Pseudouridine synthase RsuA/RluA-like domain-containing protein n=1 Tax=Psophocarpus tetragonolobus TaxID=3891 RepID=A0AAN9XH75_PSOTE
MEGEGRKRENYPIPLSPPLAGMSKEIELSRALRATSNSSLFSLSPSDILYQDEHLIAVNKHQGIYCETLLSSLASLSPQLHLANRLDRDTTGILLLTKSHNVAAKLVKAFTLHQVHKTYIALCTGPSPNWNRLTVRSGHGRSKFGAWRVYAASDVARSLPGGSVVRSMETSFQVLSIDGKGSFTEVSDSDWDHQGEHVLVVQHQALKEDATESEIVVRAYPRSGRTHQIRLHCQYLGISIVGDVKYDGAYHWKGTTHHAHHLHAETLSFQHPVTALNVKLHAPLPPWATRAFHH